MSSKVLKETSTRPWADYDLFEISGMKIKIEVMEEKIHGTWFEKYRVRYKNKKVWKIARYASHNEYETVSGARFALLKFLEARGAA